MGYQGGNAAFKRGAETEVIRGQEVTTTFDELVDASRVQARNFAEANPKKISAFKSQNFAESIVNSNDRTKTARSLARSEPFYIAEDLETLDDQAAFLVALAEEVQAPEYNQ